MDKIVCVGKNYSEHIKEIGDKPQARPVLFLKPPSVLVAAKKMGETLTARIPPDPGLLHHECEMVLQIKKGGFHLSREEAQAAIGAVTVGLDMTFRDRQAALKKSGSPWTTSKVFLDSAIVGPFLSVEEFPNYLTETFSITVDGDMRQKGCGKEMIYDPITCVSYISEYFPLVAGDLVFTGSPAGVAEIVAGMKALLQFGKITYSVSWQNYR